MINYMSSGKATIILLTAGLIKNESFSRTAYPQQIQNRSWIRFSKLCNKIFLKNATGVDASEFAKKADLASLKSNKLDIDKLEKVSSVLAIWKVK